MRQPTTSARTSRYAGAPSYAPVARSDSTTFSEERASATRWRSGRLQAQIPEAPAFAHGAPSPELLQELVEGYEAITGTKVRAPRQRNLIAACYRVHGEDVVPYARD